MCVLNAIYCGNHVHFVCSDSSYNNSRISTLLKSVLLQVIREIPYDVVLLFTISTAITIHTGVCEPHLMRPSYTAFLNYLTDQRYLFNIFMFLLYLEFLLVCLLQRITIILISVSLPNPSITFRYEQLDRKLINEVMKNTVNRNNLKT